MDLKLMIVSANFQSQENYFMVAQLEELTYPSKELKTIKQRTDITSKTSNPQFKKNLFTFLNVSYGSRITLKLGVFTTEFVFDPGDNQELLKKSQLVGSCQLVLTQKLIILLRQEKKLEQDLQVIRVNSSKEIGRIIIALKYSPSELQAQIEDDVEMIENMYFDTFETDQNIIQKKYTQVTQKLLENYKEMQKTEKQLTFIRNASKAVSYDLGNLRNERQQLEEENNVLRQKIEKQNDVNEVHIHIDLMKQTDQGAEVLRQKLAYLMNKLQYEGSIYNELSENYFHVQNQIEYVKKLDKDLNDIKEASKEIQFHIQRNQDIMPHINNLKSQIVTQESIIKNIQNLIQQNLKGNDRITAKELQQKILGLKHDRELLVQKDKQIGYMYQLDKGQLSYINFNKLKNDEQLKENEDELKYFQKKSKTLLDSVEELTQQLEQINLQNDVQKGRVNDFGFDDYKYNRDVLLIDIEQKENEAKILQDELIKNTKQYATEIAELKNKKIKLDALFTSNSDVKFDF